MTAWGATQCVEEPPDDTGNKQAHTETVLSGSTEGRALKYRVTEAEPAVAVGRQQVSSPARLDVLIGRSAVW